MKYLDLTGVQYLWNKIKTTFASKDHSHTEYLSKEDPTLKYNSTLYAEGDAEGSVKVPLIGATDLGDGYIVLIGHGNHETRIYAA